MAKAYITAEIDQSFAIVTPTYLPDLARCELLAESLDRTNPRAAHYLIVDRRDRSAFQHLEKGQRKIIESEALIANLFWRMPWRKSYWLSFKSFPVRGWIIQQILKIAAIDAVPEHTLIFCDSDTAFFRPFDYSDILIDGKVGLLDVDFIADQRWIIAARRLLGLSSRHGGYSRGHVGNMICWNRDVVQAMRDHIEVCNNVSWQIALARTTSFSEYMLYGIFVRDVLGYTAANHTPSTIPLVKPSWGTSLKNAPAIDAFFSDFDPKTVAVMIHSKDGIEPGRYRRNLERLWST